MPQQYQFKRNVTVEGKPYREGDVVDETEIPSGSLEPCLRMKHIVPLTAAPAEESTDDAANKRNKKS